MDRFKERLRPLVKWLPLSLLGYIWRFLRWLAEQIAGDRAVRLIDEFLAGLPDILSSAILWLQEHPSIFLFGVMIILLAIMFVRDLLAESKRLVFETPYVQDWDMRRIKYEEEPEGVISTSTPSVAILRRDYTTASPAKSVFFPNLSGSVTPLGKYAIAFVDVGVYGVEEATSVTARPTFFSSKGRRLDSGRIYSRWWEKDEQAPKGDWRALRAIDIQRGNPALLAFVFKPPSENSMYAYDHAAHAKSTSELKQKGTRLGEGPIYALIKVESKDGIGPDYGWFRLRLDQNKNLVVTMTRRPMWAKKVRDGR